MLSELASNAAEYSGPGVSSADVVYLPVTALSAVIKC